MALIAPARQHQEVIVQAVAARDRKKAEAYAKKHGIGQVFGSYQELLDDASIDAVYIPLPNGLHFEWAYKALARGKHVLLEKPSTSNAAEAETLFSSPLVGRAGGPVLLEAFHYRFQPSWLLFMSLIDPPNVASAKTVLCIPKLRFADDDIRFNFALAGGAIMDLGYTISALRAIYAAEPVECTSVSVARCAAPNDRCDYAYDATWVFPNGGTGEMHGSLRAGVFDSKLPLAEATHRPVVVTGDDTLAAQHEKTRTRRVALYNFIVGAIWHRVDVEDEFAIRIKETGEVVRRWKQTETKKAYTFRDAGIDRPSEPYWLSYKHQLDAFVDRIRGREGTGVWVTPEDSIAEMRATDMVYEKSGLGKRETSMWRPE